MKVKTIGMKVKIWACTGSGGAGFIFICTNIVTPITSGQMPRWTKSGSA